MLFCGKFVIEWYDHASGKENSVGGEQPLWLIRKDDRGAIAGCEARIFERSSHGLGRFAKLPVRRSRSRSASMRQTSSGQRSSASRKAAPSESYFFKSSIKKSKIATEAQRHGEKYDYRRISAIESLYSADGLVLLSFCVSVPLRPVKAWTECA